MARSTLTAGLLLLALSAAAWGQDFSYCADVNEDMELNVMDVIFMIEEHRGNEVMPPGRGDIDLRDGRNMGDLRYLNGYVFQGYPEGGCPPFDPYPLNQGDDTLHLPSLSLPAGGGAFSLLLVMVNQNEITDLLLPFKIVGLPGEVTIASVELGEDVPTTIYGIEHDDTSGVLIFSGLIEAIDPGINVVATINMNYNSATGGTVSVDTTTLREATFLNYVHGDLSAIDYGLLTIAVPTVVSSGGPGFPNMSLEPDTLFFETLVDYPDPDPQQLTILSDGADFSWWLTKPDWIGVDKTNGMSGESVTVTPHIAGMPVGAHYGEILVFSAEALGSPQRAIVKLVLKSQYPSLDANCDGIYNITDLVLQVNYMFGQGQIPCDPCTGEPYKK